MAQWDSYAALTTLLGNLTWLIRDDGEAQAEDEIKTLTLDKMRTLVNSEYFVLNGIISPSQLTASQNNWAPTGHATATVIRFSTDASRDITGLTAPASSRNDLKILINVGATNPGVLKNESGSSTAANRFSLDADLTIAAGQSCILWYDSTSSRWRVAAKTVTGSGDFVSTLINAEVSITGAATATINRMHVVSGSSNYTVTLPAASGNTGKFLAFRFTNTGISTLDGNASETIDGVTTRAFYQDQSAILICDGSNWFSIYQKVAPRRASLNVLGLIHSAAQTIGIKTGHVYNYHAYQTSPANGDSFTGSVFLNKGSYTCAVIGITMNACGLLDWTLNGVSQTTGQDWYSAGDTANVIKTFTLTVPFTGYHILQATVNGKNGSSSNYFYGLTQIEIYPSAD